MRRMACASCATYQRQRKSLALGPYCPTYLKGVSHFHRVLLPSRIAPLSAHFRKSPGGQGCRRLAQAPEAVAVAGAPRGPDSSPGSAEHAQLPGAARGGAAARGLR